MSDGLLTALVPGLELITFDCYGTLLDWRAGIGAVLRHHVLQGGIPWEDRFFDDYVRHEARIEGGAYRPYREILTAAEEATLASIGLEPARPRLADSMATWPPFEDTVAALERLGSRYRLGVLSNVDRDLFDTSFGQLGVELDLLITADDVHAYKPAPPHFEALLARSGVGQEAILHAAQSRFHDIAACNQLGLQCVWVNRYAEPDHGPARPLAVVPDLATLADRLVG